MNLKNVLLLILIAALTACGKHDTKFHHGDGLIYPPMPGKLSFSLDTIDKGKIDCVIQLAGSHKILVTLKKTETEAMQTTPGTPAPRIPTQYVASGVWEVRGDSLELTQFSKALSACHSGPGDDGANLTTSFTTKTKG
ncbi:hypothetical protein [Undibacterium curvum]|uniref:Lipoprotein n=1 Tax=Undibacterium curvum TaxID=2762294 RepID=A0ABR7A3Y1_9BURK|nr:hypothetical protein [Undibacterium curvum]MBC3931438.1 hypothetical protein [Undibacterium curvum]